MKNIKCFCGKNDGECTYRTLENSGFSLAITDIYYIYCHGKKKSEEIGKEIAEDYTNDDSTYCSICGEAVTKHRKLSDILKEEN